MTKILQFVFGVAAYIVIGAFLWAGTANAGKYQFGTDETLTKYAATGMTADGETTPLSLCYRASTYYVFAGVYTSDEKVLCNDAQTHYWPVPTRERLAQLQQAGFMPKPVPDYERPVIEYAIGYSLWLVLAVTLAWVGGAAALSRSKEDDNSEEPSLEGEQETVA